MLSGKSLVSKSLSVILIIKTTLILADPAVQEVVVTC